MQRNLGFIGLALLTALVLSACASVVTDIAPTHVASLTPPASATSDASGAVQGRLVNVSLILEGDYRDLGSPVTSVRVEREDGGALYSLQASGGTSGTFSRTQDLKADDITALNNGELVVVVYTEDYPEGTEGELRGTLSPS